MAQCSWETHGDVRYLYSDQRVGSDEVLAANIRLSWRMREEVDGPVVVLADVRGSTFVPSAELRAEIKRMQYAASQRHETSVVLLGLHGVSAAFVRGLSFMGGGVRILPARDEAQAMDLLLREHERLLRRATG